jgi:ABC-type polysaccharide/polyol phosphate transport system ATPase subunit
MFNDPIDFFFNRAQKIDILKNISLEIKQGEKVGLIGINGAGKTSLCRTISGMYGTKKEINVTGQLRSIFDTASVIQPELSGRENAWIITNIIYAHMSKKERQEIVEDALSFSELNEFTNSPFKFYSKGMKVRLFLSIVSAKPCDLLILDEVFNGADIFFNEKISARIHNVINTSGAVIFISHSEEILREVCNRAVVLGNQKILFDGSVEDAITTYHKLYGQHIKNELLI